MQRNVLGLTVSAIAMGATLSRLAVAAPPLLTPEQQESQTQALALKSEAAVIAARAEAIRRYQSAPPARSTDGIRTLNDSVDEVVYGSLLALTNDPLHPKVLWNQALPYDFGTFHIPGGRYGGDDPDRIYRTIAVDPAHRYSIHGRRRTEASLDFSFEAIPGPALWGKAKNVLQLRDIDVAVDGSFEITADGTPADGRRNHLQLPPGTTDILIRDTLDDWAHELPNELTVDRLDAGATDANPRDILASRAGPDVQQSIGESLSFIAGVSKSPPNHLYPVLRGLGDGVKGGVIAVNRFRIRDDEALILTLDPIGAKYLGVEVTDPWARSADYSRRSTSLNNTQAKADADGRLTYVLSNKDTGIHNWLDAAGLHEGLLLVRWEVLPTTPQVDKAVSQVKLVKLSELAAALPDGVARIGPDQRQQWLADRSRSYEHRLGQQ